MKESQEKFFSILCENDFTSEIIRRFFLVILGDAAREAAEAAAAEAAAAWEARESHYQWMADTIIQLQKELT